MKKNFFVINLFLNFFLVTYCFLQKESTQETQSEQSVEQATTVSEGVTTESVAQPEQAIESETSQSEKSKVEKTETQSQQDQPETAPKDSKKKLNEEKKETVTTASPVTSEQKPIMIKEGESTLVNLPSDVFEKDYEEAREINKKIQTAIDQLSSGRSELNNKYVKIDADLDNFFQKVSILNGTILSVLTEKNSEYKKEWDLFKNETEQLDKLENKLLESLKVFDSKLTNIIDESVKSRKLSGQILNIKTNEEAKKIVDQLNVIFNNVIGIQKEISSNVILEFEKNLEQIKTNLQKLDQDFKKLEENAIKLEIIKKDTKNEKLEAHEQIQAQKARIETKQSEVKAESQHSILFNSVVNFVSWIIYHAKKLLTWGANLFGGQSSIVVSDISTKDQNKKSEKKQVLETTVQHSLVSDTNSVNAAALEERVDQDKLKLEIKEIEINIKNLEEEKKQIEQKGLELDKLRKQKEEDLKKKLNLAAEFDILEKKEVEKIKEAVEKKPEGVIQTVEYFFSRFLDFLAFLFTQVKDFSIYIYTKYLKDRVVTFVSAVKNRLSVLEQEDTILQKKGIPNSTK